ncbi:unnamed protein product [Polarella glacialis]|uniref:Uncharacterized protein n=1 Tax=Polarella glacialis TaxID=89957 RepID=A0A813ENJ0_POLGL|nr:unnamed protein product [Polarella glacialis]
MMRAQWTSPMKRACLLLFGCMMVGVLNQLFIFTIHYPLDQPVPFFISRDASGTDANESASASTSLHYPRDQPVPFFSSRDASGTVANASAPASTSPVVVRDCELEGLVALLNTFDDWDGVGNLSSPALKAFFEHLAPWVVAEPSSRTRNPEEIEALRPPRPTIDCNASRYRGVFTGRRLPSPRPVVDLVPFGFDLAMLELRLLETADAVDLFVVSESEASEKPGHEKPLFFDMAKDQPRFARFRPKILHVIRRANTSGVAKLKGMWALETSTRGWPTACLSALVFEDMAHDCYAHSLGGQGDEGQHARRLLEENLGLCGWSESGGGPRRAVGSWGVPEALATIIKNRNEALLFQNDEDELMTREVALHLKHCELKKPHTPVYAPTTLFKINMQHLQPTNHVKCLGGSDLQRAPDYGKYLWKNNNIARLVTVACNRTEAMYPVEIDGTNFLRRHNPCTGPGASDHLGFGSGIHLSSTADPVQTWLKGFSVLEANMGGDFPVYLLQAAKNASVTPSHLIRWLSAKSCQYMRATNVVHISQVSAGFQEFSRSAMPWALKAAPERFCFHNPVPPAIWSNQLSIASLAHKDFKEKCTF